MVVTAEVKNGLPFKEGDYILEILLKDVKYYIFPKVLTFSLLNQTEKTNYNLQLGPEHGNLYIPHNFNFKKLLD